MSQTNIIMKHSKKLNAPEIDRAYEKNVPKNHEAFRLNPFNIYRSKYTYFIEHS